MRVSISIPEEITEAYSQDIDPRKLQRQLQMLPDLVSSYKVTRNMPTFHVTSMRTLSEMLLSVPLAKELFSEIDKILHIDYNSYC